MNAQIQETRAPHVAESQHWYDRNGNAVYEVDSADGKRKVTPDLRHARKLGLLPGYTSVAKMLAKPGLERWKARQMMLAALTLPRNALESDESFIARVEQDANAQAAARAAEGIEVHKAIEQSLRNEPFDQKWAVHVAKVRDELDRLPRPFLGDFKTKEALGDKTDKELFFDEHIMQLAAYLKGLEGSVSPMTGYICERTFACRAGYGGRVDIFTGDVGNISLVSILIGVKDCTVRVKVWTPEEAERGWQLFSHALAVWKLRNYDSAFP